MVVAANDLHLVAAGGGDAVALGVVAPAALVVDVLRLQLALRLAEGEAGVPLGTAEAVVVDGRQMIPRISLPQRAVIGGDRTCLSIGAASILAKEIRDRMMEEYDLLYPGYGFARHKGYATPEHTAALDTLGPCPIHRRSFAPLRLMNQNRLAL